MSSSLSILLLHQKGFQEKKGTKVELKNWGHTVFRPNRLQKIQTEVLNHTVNIFCICITNTEKTETETSFTKAKLQHLIKVKATKKEWGEMCSQKQRIWLQPTNKLYSFCFQIITRSESGPETGMKTLENASKQWRKTYEWKQAPWGRGICSNSP